MDVLLSIEGLTKSFGTANAAVNGADLVVRAGEVVTLLGPSGCGKTTTLRMVSGLERGDSGRIVYGGRTVADFDAGMFVPPHKRGMGMVFQSYAVWPHMTVYQNVAYPLKMQRVRRSEMRRRVEATLEIVGMAELIDRPATQLSGGQQQRVAIGRALIHEPDLLLLDEPFSNLDARLRQQMRIELKLLQRRLGLSVLFVTHDQIEALTLSNRIAVMDSGRVIQSGTPAEVYDHPDLPFVRDFLGQSVLFPGQVVDVTSDGYASLALEGGSGSALLRGVVKNFAETSPGQQATASIRPEEIRVHPRGDDDDEAGVGEVDGKIDALLFVGERFDAGIVLNTGAEILLNLPRSGAWSEGQSVRLHLPMERIFIWTT